MTHNLVWFQWGGNISVTYDSCIIVNITAYYRNSYAHRHIHRPSGGALAII